MIRYTTMAFVLALGCGSKPTEKKAVALQPAETKPVASAPVKTPESTPAPAANVVMPTFKKEKMTLYDPRAELKTQSVPKEEAEKLLGKLFTKRLTKMEECKPDQGEKESKEDIESGQIVPSVVTKLTGSFTAAGLVQDLYIVDVGECNAVETRDSAATSGLWVIREKDEIKAKLDAGKATFFIPFDVDQNGTLELLTVVEGSSGGGGSYQYAELFMLSDKEAKSVESFTTNNVMNDECNIPLEEGAATFQEIMVVSLTPTEPGKLPTFSGEKLSGTCDKNPTWKPIP